VPGLGLVSYITLSRNDGRGTTSLAVLLERNKENGEPYQFYQTRVIGSGTPGRFNDKPAMLTTLDPAGGTINVGGRQIPRGTIHYAYSLFPGNDNNNSSQIYYTFSRDYGLTWSNPNKLSESLGINQGADLAVDDATNTIIATWRQVADTNQSDGIVFAKSSDGGQTWTKAKALWTAPAGTFFDQDTSGVQFRTRSMPSIVHDGSAFHVFWSARGFAGSGNVDDARIVVSSSRDGRTWSAPAVVSPYAGRGHQIIPQAAVAGGRIQVDWIDTRNNEPGSFGRLIADFRVDANGTRVALDAPYPTDGTKHYIYRQSGDIYAAQSPVAPGSGSPALAFSASQAISRYRFGLVNGVRRQLEYNFLNARIFQKGAVAFNGDYHALTGQRYRASPTTPGAWIRNTAPSTSNAIFYSAFTDNRDIEGYVWAGPPASAFTPAGVTTDGENGFELAASCSASQDTNADQTVWTASDSPRSRYQNIYAATTLPGLVVASPSGSKPTGTLERAYVVFVQNLTDRDRRYQLDISNQPTDAPPSGNGRASFRPDNPSVSGASCVAGTDCRSIQVAIPRGSSTTRTVYVRSSQTRPRITVSVTEIGGTQTGSLILNANPNVAEIENPDSLEFLPGILAAENYQPDIIQRQFTFYSTGVVNPDVTPVTLLVENPRIEYPRIEYPRIEYPRIEYPRIEYPRIEYDAVGTPRIEYPRIEYPRIEYNSVQNPRIEYSPLSGDDTGVTATTQVAEVTWPVSTASGANTMTGMSSEVFLTGVLATCSASVTQNCLQGAQLLVSIPQFYTVNRTCDGQQAVVVENQVIVNNVVDLASLAPSATGPDTVNPLTVQPSFFVGPTQTAFVTLRLVGKFDESFGAQLGRRSGLIVRSQPDVSAIDQSNDDQDGTIDTTPPTLNLAELAAAEAFLAHVEGNAAGGARVTVPTVTATDDSGSASVSCVRTQGTTTAALPVDGTSTLIPLGSWTGSCTATDLAGNQTTPAAFPISVEDHTPPTLNVTGLAATVTLTPSVNGAILSYNPSVVTASDLVDSTLTVSCTPPVGTVLAAGTTTIQCSATDDSSNTGTATYSFTVGKATTTTTVTVNAVYVYDGSPHGGTATVTGAGGLSQTLTVTYSGTAPTVYGPTAIAPTNAGTYSAAATYAENAGYTGSSDAKTYTISQATSTTTVTCPASASYTGSPVTPCSVSVTGAGGLSLSQTPLYINNINPGTATASYTYAGDANHTGSSDSKTFTIAVPYGFVVVSFPASGNQGSAIPMSWRYTLNGAPFNSSSLLPVFRAVELTSCNNNGTETGPAFDNQYAPGNSNFQFSATSPYTWQYNWQTKAFKAGTCYNIYIVTKNSSGAIVQKNLMGKIKLN
jgi:hypothetical protein